MNIGNKVETYSHRTNKATLLKYANTYYICKVDITICYHEKGVISIDE